MAVQLAQTTFAALAFAGAGFLFKSFDKRDEYENEIKRHNKALEDLSKAKEAFYENQVKMRNKLDEARRNKIAAKGDMVKVNDALAQLRALNTITHNDKIIHRKPHLTDYYKPSDKMNYYVSIASIGIGAGAGLLAWYLI